MSATYQVYTMGYCGMRIPHGDGMSWAQAKERARQRIAYYKRVFGGEVTRQYGSDASMEWELQEPENCCMVPDACGYLRIKKE